MNLNLIKAATVAFVALGSIAFQAQAIEVDGVSLPDGTEVDISDNNVGLPNFYTCKTLSVGKGLAINCYPQIISFGKVFETKTFANVDLQSTCASCTPGHLLFENYIGKVVGPKPEEVVAGKRSAVIFCNGKCTPRAINKG